MRYERVKVKRDERTVYNRPVLPWEIAILEFTFGDGSVERLGVFVDNDAEYPEPKEEFMRLMGTYGSDPESGIPHVASVYGQAAAGIRALSAEIKEAKADARKAAPKQSRKTLVKEYSGDSLLG
jgi:hypothetical protein